MMPPDRQRDIGRALDDLLPRVLQGNVTRVEVYTNAAAFRVRLDGVKLLAIVEVEAVDGELWGHMSVSASTPKRIPTWPELRWCKEYFLGDRKAIQVLPPRAEYVNLNPNVLHLYAPLDRDPLPDFRHPTGGI